jgi:hypothetical protein
MNPFGRAKKNQNAMKVSGLASGVIAAPVNAEERLLKVCASVAENKNCINHLERHWTGRQ